MASNYTGNPTAVQSPATAPAVNTPIVISIPTGTDVRTIESIMQQMKVGADNLTFILQILGGTRSALGLVIDGVGGSSALASGASHIVITGTAPSIAAGAGAGTGASASIAGNDTTGQFSVSTGTSPTTSSTFCTITFATTRTTATPRIFLQPANAQTAALSTAQQIYPFAISTSAATIESGTSAIGASATYQWNYWITG